MIGPPGAPKGRVHILQRGALGMFRQIRLRRRTRRLRVCSALPIHVASASWAPEVSLRDSGSTRIPRSGELIVQPGASQPRRSAPPRYRSATMREISDDFLLNTERSVFDAAGGMDGLRRLAEAWHACVMADEVVGHAFSHGFHPQHTERLAAYWAEALGGPTAYSDQYGDETSVVRMHSGNGVHTEMDRRAIACFDQALTDTGLAADDRLRRVLHDYFAWATTTSLARYHESADDVPKGLRIPRWSWDGLVEERIPRAGTRRAHRSRKS
jgi:hemoglobin